MTPMPHLTDDDLVLHYYGELDADGASGAETHLAGCDDCRTRHVRLQRVLAAVSTVPAPAIADGFERTVWARLEPALGERRPWFQWFVLSPANLAWVSVVLLLVAGAFVAGRMSREAQTGSAVASAERVREGVLLIDLGEHLDRSQTMLVELASAETTAGAIDVSLERERAGELVAANRLYRQAASVSGDAAVSGLLDELERLLVELAASPDTLAAEDVARVQQQITARDLLFKVRVVNAAVRERQKAQIHTDASARRSS